MKEKTKNKAKLAKKTKLLKQIENGLRDVKKMLDGKKPRKTLKQFLDEQSVS